MNFRRLTETAAALGCDCRENEPMAAHTTFRIGGPADLFFTVETKEQLLGLANALKEEGTPFLLLGNGSNLLVSDKGIRGAVISLSGEFRKIQCLPDRVTLRAGAGVSLASLCAFAREHSLTGLEFAWGIPGTVGGALYMNAGAYGGEMKDVATTVYHMTSDGQMGKAEGEALGLSYRRSRYSEKDEVILWGEFTLSHGEKSAISGKMEELMGRRKEKQPYDLASAGSVFKRPAVGYAAALIDECGLKGARMGGAQVSEKHAGFIVNTGGASCKDVLALIAQVQAVVEEKKGIRLEREVRLVGEF